MRLFLSTLVFFIVQPIICQVVIEKEPYWIVEEKYSIDAPIPKNGLTGGAQVLLYTEQINVGLEEVYYKSVGKAVDYSGIQSIARVSADYDPNYQTLRFHHVDVIREGKTINRLRREDIQTARRETNSENFIYDGTITAFLNIPDVRIGDITVFSYSIKGFNPIQKNKFTTSFVLNSTVYIDKVSAHIFSSKKLKYIALNTNIDAAIRTKNGTTHYSWSNENVPAMEIDENVPLWHIQNATIFISEYESWSQVIDWGSKLFTFDKPMGQEFNTIVDHIKSNNATEGEQILAALKFVQNEVRYLALLSGIGSYQPNAPDKVIAQRFGDCKDKSVLFTALLNAMDIEAYPTLVNTRLKHIVTDLMPSSKAFDHCIVKVVDKNGSSLWYDPTLMDQGGSFTNVFIPDYRFGLVLDKQLSYLDTISNFQHNMVERFSTLKIDEVGKGAELQVKSHFFDGEADYLRNVLKNNNNDIIDKELLSIVTQNYGRVTALAPFEFVDDSKKNEIALLERYQLDSIWTESVENPNFLNLTIAPYTITSRLSMPTQLERTTPYALNYPMVRKHSFEIKLPEEIRVRPESFNINSDYFYYDFNSKYDVNSNTLHLSYYYKSQNDHVPPSDFDTFYDEMVKLDRNIGYFISTKTENSWVTNTSILNLKSSFRYVLAGVLFVLIIVAGVIFLMVKKRTKREL